MPQLPIPDSGSLDVFGEARKGPEIHSAKAHRCVDKVGRKGHSTSSSWAICTASIGKEGVYTKGHGGAASQKRRRTREQDRLDAEAEAILAEFNDCHAPAGSSQGGQFCGKGGKSTGRVGKALSIAKAVFDAYKPRNLKKAFKSFGRDVKKAHSYRHPMID